MFSKGLHGADQERPALGRPWANGAGKSNLLELITGENVQGDANEIHLFGRRKGSGESIWEIKEKLSTVSAEFQMRYQNRIPAYDVICSGLLDSTGLYQGCTEEQHLAVREWIGLLDEYHPVSLLDRCRDSSCDGFSRVGLCIYSWRGQPQSLCTRDILHHSQDIRRPQKPLISL